MMSMTIVFISDEEDSLDDISNFISSINLTHQCACWSPSFCIYELTG